MLCPGVRPPVKWVPRKEAGSGADRSPVPCAIVGEDPATEDLSAIEVAIGEVHELASAFHPMRGVAMPLFRIRAGKGVYGTAAILEDESDGQIVKGRRRRGCEMKRTMIFRQ